MRWLILVAALALGCASMTADDCRRYVSVARLAIGECDRIADPDDAGSCRAAATAALILAEQECSRIPDAPVEAA